MADQQHYENLVIETIAFLTNNYTLYVALVKKQRYEKWVTGTVAFPGAFVTRNTEQLFLQI